MLCVNNYKTLYVVVMNKVLRFTVERVVWQEVPGEVSLAYSVSGCPLRCPGCHSSDSWGAERGTPLSAEYLNGRIEQYWGMITCVAFFGGEWDPAALVPLLKLVREAGLHTCLYSGHEFVARQVLRELTFLKTGPWIQKLGGLESLHTNQKFIDLRTNKSLNHLFINQSPGERHATSKR